MLFKLIWQLTIFSVISALIGAAAKVKGFNFYGGCLFGAAIQYIFYWGYINIVNAWIALANKKLENERLKEYTLQGLDVECPCPKKIHDFVPVKLNSDNYFNCRACGKKCNIIITAETALATVPIDGIKTEIIIPENT